MQHVARAGQPVGVDQHFAVDDLDAGQETVLPEWAGFEGHPDAVEEIQHRRQALGIVHGFGGPEGWRDRRVRAVRHFHGAAIRLYPLWPMLWLSPVPVSAKTTAERRMESRDPSSPEAPAHAAGYGNSIRNEGEAFQRHLSGLFTY